MTDQVSSDLPRSIGKPATRGLHGAGYTQLAQLTTVTEAELLALHGVGPKAIRILKAALNEQGLAFAAGKEKG
jgi:predicted flap endonuclease-1-like 5' DNA nuclease